jgi:hypothetical protein
MTGQVVKIAEGDKQTILDEGRGSGLGIRHAATLHTYGFLLNHDGPGSNAAVLADWSTRRCLAGN